MNPITDFRLGQAVMACTETRLASLRQQIDTGLARRDKGQGIAIESREPLHHLMDAIKVAASI